MTHPRLKEIEERLAKATPGPWKHGHHSDDEDEIDLHFPLDSKSNELQPTGPNVTLIANAPADLALCLRVIEEMRAALEFYASPWGAHHGFDDCSNTAITKVLNEQTVTARQALARVDELCGGEE